MLRAFRFIDDYFEDQKSANAQAKKPLAEQKIVRISKDLKIFRSHNDGEVSSAAKSQSGQGMV
ncbi:hypothetical protein HGRIS_014568 [Hohenbuehelia grisea]|uniref:Uncharacterized protein n=1 Tax=Hohenbuehelia grisea TaxID=104357 RepID=A0ABR3JUH4_9AGAR